MSVEYVKLNAQESTEQKKLLLEVQVSSLTSIKRLLAYRKLRSEECADKITLKTKMEELRETLALIDRMLPKTTAKEALPDKPRPHHAVHVSLEQELDQLKSKLASLR